MLAFWGSRFQYFLSVSLKDGAECAQIALWILEAFMAGLSLVRLMDSRHRFLMLIAGAGRPRP